MELHLAVLLEKERGERQKEREKECISAFQPGAVDQFLESYSTSQLTLSAACPDNFISHILT